MNSRFSLLNLFFAMGFFAAILSAYNYRRQLLASQAATHALRQELDESRPISFGSVKQQIILTTQDIASTEVTAVHYNPLRDRYRVRFVWLDPKGKQKFETDVPFEPDGQGRYLGNLYEEPFAKDSIGVDGSQVCKPFVITIKDDISRFNDMLKRQGIAPVQNENWPIK